MSLRRKLLAALALVASLAVLGFAFLYFRISHPPVERRLLPAGLVSLDSEEGHALLASATAHADHDVLAPWAQTQQKASWCGVASSATVLSGLEGRRVAQEEVIERGSGVRSFLRITFGGMPLDDLGRILRANGAEATVVHADASSVERLRATLRENLARPDDFLLVNYARASLGQGDTGHISPVSAYDEATDRVLVLDTARYKWPATWIRVPALFRAMDTVDSDGGKRRGWVVVRR
ncbi:MAG: phytochelatin synthase family protein [Polyangiales bacterium]